MSIPDAPSAQDCEKNASATNAAGYSTELDTSAHAPGEGMDLDHAPTEIPEPSDTTLDIRGVGGADDVMGNAEEAPAAAAAAALSNPAQGNATVEEAQAADEVNEGAVAPPPAKPLCGVCGENIGKYKCARCQLPLYVFRTFRPPYATDSLRS